MEDLIIYSSTDGQTKRICETIKDHLEYIGNIFSENVEMFKIINNIYNMDWETFIYQRVKII